jgi:hypothetical protein
MITFKTIQKLIKSQNFELVDNDQVYFTVSEELEIDLVVSYDAYAESDYDGYFDHSTYRMNITDITIDVDDKWIRPKFMKEEMKKLVFSSELEEKIKENYLVD